MARVADGVSSKSCQPDRPAERYCAAVSFRQVLLVQIRAELKKRGQMIGADDLFIAAHARSLGLRLVTNDTAEFGRVKGLMLENWTLPVRRSRSRGDE